MTLHRRGGDWYLYASMLTGDGDTTTGHRTVLRVNQFAVASTGRFWSADEFNHWKQEHEKQYSDLQQCGTRAAHKAITGIKRKQDRHFEMFLHRVASEIIAEAVEHDCSHTVFEDLTSLVDERTDDGTSQLIDSVSSEEPQITGSHWLKNRSMMVQA